MLKDIKTLQALIKRKGIYKYLRFSVFSDTLFDVFWKNCARVTGYSNCQRNKSSMLIIIGLVFLSQNQLLMPTMAIINKVNPKYLLLLLFKYFEKRMIRLKTKQ